MPIVEWKCKKCGGAVEVDVNNKSGRCLFCGTTYTEEQIIQYTSNNYYINEAQFNIDINIVEGKLKAADVFLTEFKNYSQAEKIFAEVTLTQPSNYMGWWGLARVATKEFSDFDVPQRKFVSIKNNAQNAIIVATPDKKEELQFIWNDYERKCNESLNTRKTRMGEIVEEIKGLDKIINQQNKEYNNLKQSEKVFSDRSHAYSFLTVKYLFMHSGEGWLFLILSLIGVFIIVGTLVSAANSYGGFDINKAAGGLLGVLFIAVPFLIIFFSNKRKGKSDNQLKEVKDQISKIEPLIKESQDRKAQLQEEYNNLNSVFDNDK